MIRVIQANANHANIIKPKKVYLDNPRIIDQTKVAIATSHSITMLSPAGEMLAIIGCHMVFEGVGEFWALTSDTCEKYPIAFHRKMLAMLDIYMSERKLRRVQMTVRHSFKQGIKWAKALGFEQEGLLRKYGPEGDDYVMMGRVR